MRKKQPEAEKLTSEAIPAVYGGLLVKIGELTLPKPGDDIEYEHGLYIYDQMSREPVLNAVDGILRMLVLEADLAFEPAHKAPESDSAKDYAQLLSLHEESEKVRAYVASVVEDLAIPIRTVLWQMLEAYGHGHKLAEIVTEIVDGEIRVTAIKPKPRQAYQLVVDQFFDFKGVNIGATGFVQTSSENNGQTRVIPESLWLFTPQPKDLDPRGIAAFRACYTPWYDKLLTRPESLKFIRQFGGGMVTLTLPLITEKNRYVDINGSKVEKITYYQSLLSQFATNGGAFTMEEGMELKLHSIESEGSAFEAKFDRADREMALAFLKSTRAILEAEHGSKADSETATGLLASVVNWLRRSLCDSFVGQVVRYIVQLKFGEEAVKNLLPKPVMQILDQEDVPALLTALKGAVPEGEAIITSEQLPFWDRKLGQPVRQVTNESEDELEPPEDDGDLEDEEGAPEGASFRRKANSDRQRLSERYSAAAKVAHEVCGCNNFRH